MAPLDSRFDDDDDEDDDDADDALVRRISSTAAAPVVAKPGKVRKSAAISAPVKGGKTKAEFPRLADASKVETLWDEYKHWFGLEPVIHSMCNLYAFLGAQVNNPDTAGFQRDVHFDKYQDAATDAFSQFANVAHHLKQDHTSVIIDLTPLHLDITVKPEILDDAKATANLVKSLRQLFPNFKLPTAWSRGDHHIYEKTTQEPKKVPNEPLADMPVYRSPRMTLEDLAQKDLHFAQPGSRYEGPEKFSLAEKFLPTYKKMVQVSFTLDRAQARLVGTSRIRPDEDKGKIADTGAYLRLVLVMKTYVTFPLEYALFVTGCQGRDEFIPKIFRDLINIQVHFESGTDINAEEPPFRISHIGNVKRNVDAIKKKYNFKPTVRPNEDGFVISGKTGAILWVPDVDDTATYLQLLKGAYDPATLVVKPNEQIPELANRAVLSEWVYEKFTYTTPEGYSKVINLTGSFTLDTTTIARYLNSRVNDYENVIKSMRDITGQSPICIDIGAKLAGKYAQMAKQKGADISAAFFKGGISSAITYLNNKHYDLTWGQLGGGGFEPGIGATPGSASHVGDNVIAAFIQECASQIVASFDKLNVPLSYKIDNRFYYMLLGKYCKKKTEFEAAARANITKNSERSTAIQLPKGYAIPNLPGIKGTLPHQASTLVDLDKSPDVVVLDVAAGGGKTLLLLIDALRRLQKGLIKRVLIICPGRLVKEWISEVNKYSDGQVNVFPLRMSTMARLRNHLHMTRDDVIDYIRKAPLNTVYVTDFGFLSSTRDPFTDEWYDRVLYGDTEIRFHPNTLFLRQIGFDLARIDECFLGDQKVLIDYDKAVTMEEIYRNPAITHVLSYDLDKKQIVRKRIINKLRTAIRATTSWSEIMIRDGNKTAKLWPTTNHNIFLDSHTESPAAALTTGDKLITYGGDFQVLNGCPYCTELFSDNYALSYHIAAQHPEHSSIMGKCEICGQTMMRRHLSRHRALKHNPNSVEAAEIRTYTRKGLTQFRRTRSSKRLYQTHRERMTNNNPMRNVNTRRKAGRGISRAFWAKPAHLRDRQVATFMNAPLHTGDKPNKVEQKIVDLQVPNLLFTGDGYYFTKLQVGGELRAKNPDFIYVPAKCGTCQFHGTVSCPNKRALKNTDLCDEYQMAAAYRTNKVVKVMDLEYWHSKKEAEQIKRAYRQQGIDCLILPASMVKNTPAEKLRGRLESFVNNHSVQVMQVKSSHVSHQDHLVHPIGIAHRLKTHLFKYDLTIEDSHNYFAVADGEHMIPVLVHNSHYVKNNSSRTRVSRTILAEVKQRGIASGTMLKNTAEDMVGQWSMLNPAAFETVETFQDRYGQGATNPGAGKAIGEIEKHYGVRLVRRRQHWAFMLPRIKINYFEIPLTPVQQAFYEKILDKAIQAIMADPKLAKLLKEGDESKAAAIESLLAKRLENVEQFINAPDENEAYVNLKAVGHLPVSDRLDAHGYKSDMVSPKVRLVDQLINAHFAGGTVGDVTLKPSDSKVIVFCYHKATSRHIMRHTKWKKTALHYTAGDEDTLLKFRFDPKYRVLIADMMCFPGYMQVLIDYDKSVPIEEIYNDKSITHVLTYDLKSRKIERKKIIHRLRYANEKEDEWVQVSVYDSKKKQTLSFEVTSNHQIFKADGSEIAAGDLKPGDKLITYDGEFGRYKRSPYTEELVRVGHDYMVHTATHMTIRCPHCSFLGHPQAVNMHRAKEHGDFEEWLAKLSKSGQAKLNKLWKNPKFRQKVVAALGKANSDPRVIRRKLAGIKRAAKAGVYLAAYWNKPKRVIDRVNRLFIQSSRYKGEPTKAEQALINLDIANLQYTGDGSYFTRLTLNGKRVNKNPDFIHNDGRFRRTRKVVELMDFEYWHDLKEVKPLVAAYKEQGIDCLVLNAQLPIEEMRSRIESHFNNHYIEVTRIRKIHKRDKLGDYKFDLHIEGNTNYFVVAGSFGHPNRGNIPVLVHNSMKEGLNLQVAGHVINTEILWSPGDEEQAISRAMRPDVDDTYHRDAVLVSRLISLKTMEVAKCVVGNSLVATKERGILRIGSMGVGREQDLSLTVGSRYGTGKTAGWIYNGKQKTIAIETEDGYKEQGTYFHRMLSLQDDYSTNWTTLRNLTYDDYLCVSPVPVIRETSLKLTFDESKFSSHGNAVIPQIPSTMTTDLAFVLGGLDSEGTISNDRSGNTAIVVFGNTDYRLVKRWMVCFQKVFGLKPNFATFSPGEMLCPRTGSTYYNTKRFYEARIQNIAIGAMLSQLGCYVDGRQEGKRAAHWKRIPWSILQADGGSQMAYTAAYIEGDGSSGAGSGVSCTIYSYSSGMLDDFRVLLQSHGIFSTWGTPSKKHDLHVSWPFSLDLLRKVNPFLVSKKVDLRRNYQHKHCSTWGIPIEPLRKFLDQRRVTSGFKPNESDIIQIIGQSKTGMTLQDVAAGIDRHISALARDMSDLANHGYLQREQSQEDGRVYLWKVTDKLPPKDRKYGSVEFVCDDGSILTTRRGWYSGILASPKLRYSTYLSGGYKEFLTTLQKISNPFYQNLLDLFNQQYAFTRVMLKKVGKRLGVYDLEMHPDMEPAYTVNGLVSHNTARLISKIVNNMKVSEAENTHFVAFEKETGLQALVPISMNLDFIRKFENPSQVTMYPYYKAHRSITQWESNQYDEQTDLLRTRIAQQLKVDPKTIDNKRLRQLAMGKIEHGKPLPGSRSMYCPLTEGAIPVDKFKLNLKPIAVLEESEEEEESAKMKDVQKVYPDDLVYTEYGWGTLQTILVHSARVVIPGFTAEPLTLSKALIYKPAPDPTDKAALKRLEEFKRTYAAAVRMGGLTPFGRKSDVLVPTTMRTTKPGKADDIEQDERQSRRARNQRFGGEPQPSTERDQLMQRIRDKSQSLRNQPGGSRSGRRIDETERTPNEDFNQKRSLPSLRTDQEPDTKRKPEANLYTAVINGQLAIMAEEPPKAVQRELLARRGWLMSPRFTMCSVKAWGNATSGLDGLLNQLEDNFVIQKDRLKEIEDVGRKLYSKTSLLQTKPTTWASIRNFFTREHKPVPNASYLVPYPIIWNGRVHVAVNMNTQAKQATKLRSLKAVPNTTRWTVHAPIAFKFLRSRQEAMHELNELADILDIPDFEKMNQEIRSITVRNLIAPVKGDK